MKFLASLAMLGALLLAPVLALAAPPQITGTPGVYTPINGGSAAAGVQHIVGRDSVSGVECLIGFSSTCVLPSSSSGGGSGTVAGNLTNGTTDASRNTNIGSNSDNYGWDYTNSIWRAQAVNANGSIITTPSNSAVTLVGGNLTSGSSASNIGMLVLGYDGTNDRALLTTTGGRLLVTNDGASPIFVQGVENAASAVNGGGLRMMGSDGTNARDLLTDTGGRLILGNGPSIPLAIQGQVASAAADSGNPVKVGGVYNSTLPTFTTGQRGDLQIGSRGNLFVSSMFPTSGGFTGQTFQPGFDVDTSLQPRARASINFIYNGTSQDAQVSAPAAQGGTGTGVQAAGMMGLYKATPPTLTDGQFGTVLLDPNGRLRVSFTDTVNVITGAPADGATNSVTGIMAVRNFGQLFNGTSWDRNYSATAARASSGTGVAAVLEPSISAQVSPTPAVAQNNTALLLKASSGNVYHFNVVSGSVAGFVVLDNVAAVRTSGTATAPLYCMPLAANSGLDVVRPQSQPLWAPIGSVVEFSTSCGNFTPVGTPAVFIEGEAQ